MNSQIDRRARSKDGTRVMGALGGLLTLFALFMAAPAWADDPPELEVLGVWGGWVETVFIEEEVDPWVAYVGSGRLLVILDVEDPANIIELGSIDLGNLVRAVTVRDGYAYVCTLTRPNYFCVVDVSELSAPSLVWNYQDQSNMQAQEVDLYGDVAYVRDDDRLKAFDISDPENPVYERQIWIQPHFYPNDSTIVGDLLYAVDDFQHLRILDLSVDPLYPTELVSLTLPGTEESGQTLAVAGDYAYVMTQCGTAWDGAFTVVNVSDPNAPFVLGTYTDFYNAQDVAVWGGFAFVADWQDGAIPDDRVQDVVILDVATDPNNPTFVGNYQTHGSVYRIEIFGQRAYVMDEGEGLIILDISGGRGAPVRLGSWHSPYDLRKMDKVGDLLYITDEWNGITILDVSDVQQPELVGVYQTGEDSGRWGDNWGIEVRDQRAYLSAGYGGIEVVDVSIPAQPTMLGALRFNPNISLGMTLSGDIAHVGVQTMTTGFLVNFDISDPQNIVDVGAAELYAGPFTIDVTGGIACTTRDSAGGGTLANANTLDPTDPYRIYVGQPGGIDLVRDGSLLYLANRDCYDGGLYIRDIDDPENPVDVGYWQTPSGNQEISGIALRNGRAYLAAWHANRLYEVDVTEPGCPVLLTETRVPHPRLILVDGRYAYITCHSQGLVIINIGTTGDLDGDGDVDLTDLATLLSNYGTSGGATYEMGDLDEDGDVDLSDLAALLANYGQGCA